MSVFGSTYFSKLELAFELHGEVDKVFLILIGQTTGQFFTLPYFPLNERFVFYMVEMTFLKYCLQ